MAVYNLNIHENVDKLLQYVNKCIDNKSIVEFKKINKKRTNSQNAYMHVLFSLWGLEHGYTSEEAKIIVKRQFKDIFVYEKNGVKFLSKTRDMNTKQMTDFIDRFRNWSAREGCYLPSPNEYRGRYEYYMNIVNVNKEFL